MDKFCLNVLDGWLDGMHFCTGLLVWSHRWPAVLLHACLALILCTVCLKIRQSVSRSDSLSHASLVLHISSTVCVEHYAFGLAGLACKCSKCSIRASMWTCHSCVLIPVILLLPDSLCTLCLNIRQFVLKSDSLSWEIGQSVPCWVLSCSSDTRVVCGEFVHPG